MLWFDAGLLLLLLCAVAVVFPPFAQALPGTLRMAVVVLAASLAPGAAVLTRVRAATPQTVIALSIALSLAIDSLTSFVLAWSRWWQPEALGGAVAVVSALLLAIDIAQRRQRSETRGGARRRLRGLTLADARHRVLATVAQVVPAGLAVALWLVSLTQFEVAHLGQYGLVPALPALWFVSLAVAVLGTCAVLHARVPRVLAIVAGVGAIALILFGTIPALTEYPQYVWTYKHLGVTRFIEAHGGIDPSVDIYNRWPGFFAPAAVLTSIAGVPDPVAYAGWAEVFFTWIDAVLVAAAVWSVSRSKRVAGGAAMLFVVVNWVGQSYYSPQAFAFTLALGCVLLLTGGLAVRETGAATRTVGLVLRLTRSTRQALPLPSTTSPRVPALVLFLVVYACIVASHQLTPYILIAQMGLLAVLGLIRPRWLVAAMSAMAIGYLVPNFGFVQDHFGFLSAFDFTRTVSAPSSASSPVAGKAFQVHAALVLAALVGLGGLAGYIRLARRQLSRQALPLGVLALTPFAVLLGGQPFGGELSLRSILFFSPWSVALISWAIATVPGRARRFLLLGATASVLAALFLPAFYGQAELNIVAPGEVRAAQYLYSHAAPGALVMTSGGNFPALSSNITTGGGNSAACLTCSPPFFDRTLGKRDVPAILAVMKGYAPRGYLVFSSSQELNERILRTAPAGSLEKLERAIAKSSNFRLWYADDGAHIYAYGPSGPVSGAPDKSRKIGIGLAIVLGGLAGVTLALLWDVMVPRRRREIPSQGEYSPAQGV